MIYLNGTKIILTVQHNIFEGYKNFVNFLVFFKIITAKMNGWLVILL